MPATATRAPLLSRPLTTAAYSLLLPVGWRVSAHKGTTVIVQSADYRAQVQIQVTGAIKRPTTSALRTIILRLTVTCVTVSRVRGVQGTATYRKQPDRLVVLALPSRSGRRVVLVTMTLHSTATTRDAVQAHAVVAGLKVRVR